MLGVKKLQEEKVSAPAGLPADVIVNPDTRRAAAADRSSALRLEERRQVGAGHRAAGRRPSRLLGAGRLPHARRPLEGRALPLRLGRASGLFLCVLCVSVVKCFGLQPLFLRLTRSAGRPWGQLSSPGGRGGSRPAAPLPPAAPPRPQTSPGRWHSRRTANFRGSGLA